MNCNAAGSGRPRIDPCSGNAQTSGANLKRIEAQLPVDIGQVQLVRNFWSEPIDTLGTARTHHLELALLPRSNVERGCFPEAWGPDRFEPIGEMFFLPADHLVHARSDCRHQNSIVCSFDPAAVARWFGELRW